jgi:ribosome-associated heat shock protein Hsp15
MKDRDHGAPSAVRIDMWLWSVRLTPTRSAATDLCRNGRVTLNGSSAKAASTIKTGDRIEARIEQRQRIVVVAELISKRVGAPIAVTCFEDHSPVVEPTAANAPVLARDRGTGRPTKSDRRKIDQLRGRP